MNSKKASVFSITLEDQRSEVGEIGDPGFIGSPGELLNNLFGMYLSIKGGIDK